MTISVETTKNTYPGTGSQVTFPYTFKIDADSDLGVLTEDANGVQTTYVLDTDYTVTGEGNQTGGNCVFVTPPAADVTVVLYDNVNFKQEVDYQQGDSFPAETHESALDKLTRQNLKQKEEIARAVKFSIASDASDVTIPDPDAGKWLAWNDAGTNLTNKNDPTTATSASAAAAAASASAAASSASAASSSASAAAASETEAEGWAATASGHMVDAELAASNVNNQRYQHIVQVSSDTFTLPFAAESTACAVYLDGVRQFPGAFTVDNRTMTFDETVTSGTEIFVITPENDVAGSTARRAQKNFIINGQFNIWQRSYTHQISEKFTRTADMWNFHRTDEDNTYTVGRSEVVPTTEAARYSMAVFCTIGGQSTNDEDIAYIEHCIEAEDFLPFWDGQGALSFWVRSSQAGTYCVSIADEVQEISYVTEYTIANADTWEKQSIIVPFTESSNSYDNWGDSAISIRWILRCGENYTTPVTGSWLTSDKYASENQTDLNQGTGDEFYIDNVQLELGDTVTLFEYTHEQDDLQKCKRYFDKSYEHTKPVGVLNTYDGMVASTVSGTTHAVNVRYSQELRTDPTVSIYSYAGTEDSVSLADMALTHQEDISVDSLVGSSKRGFFGLTTVTGTEAILFHWAAEAGMGEENANITIAAGGGE
jgi:hypothetical protein